MSELELPGGDAQAIALLERFVVDNEDLLALEALIGRFNIFDALDVARAEIRHSNFLAFVLDPAESHGLGQMFLKALLMDMLKSAPVHLRPLSPIDLDGTDLRGVEVRREWNHVDLLIKCEEPPFVVVVENKVESSESRGQLARYEAAMRQAYPDLRSLFVYLTPTADEPSDDRWIPYSYSDIHRVFTRVRASNNAIGADVLTFLDHYLGLIGTRFMNDARVDQLCQRIYVNHRRALELIFERAGRPGSGVIACAEEAVRRDARFHVFYRTRNLIDFVPKQWLEWLPPIGLDWREDPRAWLIVRFEAYRPRLDYYVEVRRIADLDKRREIVNSLAAEGGRLGFVQKGRKKMTDNYTRVSGREHIIEWSEDEEPAEEKVQAAVKAKLDQIWPKLEQVGSVLKPIVAR